MIKPTQLVTSLCLLGSLATLTAGQIKNVLFIVSDDLKASALGCYGNKICKTPHLDRLAARGMVFERTYCQGTWCAPSRLSFMHSRYEGSQGKNMGEYFRAQGMHSARVGKIYHMRVPGDIIAGTDGQDIPSTWDEKFNTKGAEAHTPGDYACLNLNIFTEKLENRESTGMKNRMFVSVNHEGDGADQPDWKAADKTVELLNTHRDKPFFIATGFVRPHYPSVAPSKFFEMYPFAKMPLPKVPEGDLTDIPKPGLARTTSQISGIAKWPDNQKRMWAAYYATVTYMDEQLGKIMDELDRLELTDSTAIVFISDHGYHLGEHHFWQKSNLHEEVTRVPMIISAPGLKPGRTQALAELTDIYPTLCSLLEIPIPKSVQGRSLLSTLKDPGARPRTGALSLLGGSHGLRTDHWAYMKYKNGDEELYDMKTDPGQFTNLAEKKEHQATKERLLTLLKERIKSASLR
ncbi:sulfatase [Akkermansiaceae bacterium]|nr:sulfatase [bacterium]MDA7907744.1 sulfatase [Akkermansiaceae bacterium]MDA8976345.1 sulfatase [bacterium]MDB4383049.1 sulfatase [Akkermansiaceae bacterium]MDB4680488.1 sulfatase [Akkermansiaceae bacterium]